MVDVERVTLYRLGALLAAAVSSGVLLAAPVYDSGRTLIEANGAEVAWTIALPVAVTGAPVIAPARIRRAATIGAASLLVIFCVLVSTGLFYVPSAVLMVLAARANPPRRRGADFQAGAPGS